MKKTILILTILLSYLSTPKAVAQGTCITTSSGGPYSVGVKTTYETLANGTDVKVTFQMLDIDKPVLLAYLFNQDPFSETIMDKEDDFTFSLTLIGQAGTITKACKMILNAGGDIVSPYVPYEVNTDCSDTNDVTPPDNFTASAGASTAFSVEFLLNGTDDSGTVAYYISYNGITKGVSVPSGPTSYVLAGLTPDTDYNFSVSARDLAGNDAANNPIDIVTATGIDTSTPCAGTGFNNDTRFPPFAIGYTYTFETLPNGTEVEITWELLDDRNLAEVNLWSAAPPEGPEFVESPMTLVSGKKYTATVSGLTEGQVIKYQCLFIAEGGALVPELQEYTVGDDCVLGVNDLDLVNFTAYPNPTTDSWKLSTKNINISSIQIIDILGKNVMTLNPNASDVVINATALKAGIYFAQIKTVSGLTSLKLVKK